MTTMDDWWWQRCFTACSLLFAVFTFAGLEVFWPQPPSFDLSAKATAAFYVENQDGFFIGVVLCSIGMAFLLAWTIQFCIMLWRVDAGAKALTLVTAFSLAASPVLLSFDLAIFGVAAFRAGETDPAVTQALSDIAWLGSQHIWPMLAVGMGLSGVLILKSQGTDGALPAWLGYFSLFVTVCELGQLPIFFVKDGIFAGDGIGSWYLATFTWGPWILAAGWAMWRILGASAVQDRLAGSEELP